MSRRLATLCGVVSAIAAMVAEANPDLLSALKGCRGIDAITARIECYDRLADEVSLPRPPVSTIAPSPAPAVVPLKEGFGLYSVEHPAAPKVAKILTARVVSFGTTAGGRQSVELSGGQVWELQASDPLLTQDDEVTITRAKLGSFLMSTPTGRSLRVRRLR